MDFCCLGSACTLSKCLLDEQSGGASIYFPSLTIQWRRRFPQSLTNLTVFSASSFTLDVASLLESSITNPILLFRAPLTIDLRARFYALWTGLLLSNMPETSLSRTFLSQANRRVLVSVTSSRKLPLLLQKLSPSELLTTPKYVVLSL